MEMPVQIRDAMLAHASFCLPDEACGLLASDGNGRLRMAYCLSNGEESPVAFTVEPAEHLGAWRHAERNGWEITGAFHSHVSGDAVPSATDVDGALDPTWINIIIGRAASSPTIGAFWIRDGGFAEEPIDVTGESL